MTAIFVLSNAATPLYVLWLRDFGFSKGTMTIVFAFYIVGLLGSLLVSGLASDRLGRKAVLLPAVALAGVACLIFATAPNVIALMIARLLTGIAVGAAVSAGMAAVTDVAGPARKHLGALLASTAMVLGAGVGPLLAGVLSEMAPAPTVTVFLVEMVLLATAFLTVMRMPVRRPVGRGTGSWVRVPRVPGENRHQLFLGIAVFAPGITATSFVLSLGPALLSGLLDTTSRIVAGAMAFAMFTTATAVQFAARALPRAVTMTISAAATASSMLALATAVHTHSPTLLITAALLAGAGQGLGQLGGLSLLNSAIPTSRLAEANAAFNIGGYLPAGLLPVSTGYLSDSLGLSTATTTFSLTLLTLSLLAGTAIFRNRRPLDAPRP
ncbi:MFS transporter [Nocardia yunnanensis]|uniref:MFS transporter n=1 Tax=Nocardia yunnanensis TaxID=2382165 RepID=A0A386ZQE9_9NOCA|nr:MFS transporter [Nocardia yunnanensis]